MVMIAAISIDAGTGFNKKSAEVKLASDKTAYERITVDLTEEETAEIIKLVSEIIATRLRLPAIKEKLEAAKAVSPMAPPPAEIKTPTGEDTRISIICPIHNVKHDPSQDCPMCAEIAGSFAERSRGMKPSDRLDDDIPF